MGRGGRALAERATACTRPGAERDVRGARALLGGARSIRFPDERAFAQGAALGVPYATAYRALFQRGGARAGETVLVHGATGGVGMAAVQIARAAGLRVLGTGGRRKGARRCCARAPTTCWTTTRGLPGARSPELTGGRGVDMILEMLANVNLGRDLRVLAQAGAGGGGGKPRHGGDQPARPDVPRRRRAAGCRCCQPGRRGAAPRSTPRSSPGWRRHRCARWWTRRSPWPRRRAPTSG